MKEYILSLNSSVFGEAGASSELNQKIEHALIAANPDAQIVRRDLVKNPLPYFDGEYLAALGAPAEQRTEAQSALVQMADQLIAELKAATVLIVAAPMYNFGVPAQLKTWFDYVARAKETFEYTATGPKGLLSNKTVYITATRGGVHKGLETDSQTAFLTTIFKFFGLIDVRFIYAEGLSMTAKKEQALQQAERDIEQEVSNYA